MYIVDTDVLSASAPTKTVCRIDLIAWMDQHSQDLFLSVVTAAEIESGIAKLSRQGSHRKAGLLAEWLEALLHLYADRILLVDVSIARAIGRLADIARGQGHDPGFADIVIAATAQVHGGVVLTRNTRRLRALKVSTLDPFDNLPSRWPSMPR